MANKIINQHFIINLIQKANKDFYCEYMWGKKNQKYTQKLLLTCRLVLMFIFLHNIKEGIPYTNRRTQKLPSNNINKKV